jgi:hypothetical protein
VRPRVDVGPVLVDAKIKIILYFIFFIFFYIFYFYILYFFSRPRGHWLRPCGPVIAFARSQEKKKKKKFYCVCVDVGLVRADALMYLRFSLGARNANGGLM